MVDPHLELRQRGEISAGRGDTQEQLEPDAEGGSSVNVKTWDAGDEADT
ncbi:hypothetical protein [Lentzea pudingi]|nr:hypothetical protein [Lentzea pudingi]